MSRAAALVAVAITACGHADPLPPPVVARPARPAPVIPPTTTQLVTAIIPDWAATTAELAMWERDGAAWRRVDTWPGVIGHAGAAWGIGLHGDGAPAGHPGPHKHEGDGTSPAGAFALEGAYGYAAAPPTGTALPYTAVAASWQCVDDPASPHYAQIVDRTTVTVDWRTAEPMRRADALYTWVVDVAHNPRRVAGAGSCIFLHVWQGPGSTTVGCTAMPEPRLAHLMATLDPSAVFVLLPRAEYTALAGDWGLPALGI